MKLSLIICTYRRPQSVCRLLSSLSEQTVVPDEVIIVDSSPDDLTEQAVKSLRLELLLKYFRVSSEYRGLTKQRNYAIEKIDPRTEIVAFLDDDVVPEPDYFEKILETYQKKPDAIGVGGIDVSNNRWVPAEKGKEYPSSKFFILDGWVYKEPARNRLRKMLGLMADLPPGKIPIFGHGRSSFPPNGRIYEVDHFMGGIASYRKQLFSKIKFSSYFEGYGLYEDFDFCVRASRFGKLYVNTSAKVWHFHDPSSRPRPFKYGTMVVRNGWYVWRQKYPNPPVHAVIKWHLITLLLAFIRIGNTITGPDRWQAWWDGLGRLAAWISLLMFPPRVERD